MPKYTVFNAETLEILRFGYAEVCDLQLQSTAPGEIVIEGEYKDDEWEIKMSSSGPIPIRKTK